MTPQVFGEYLLTSRLVERSMTEVFLAVRLGDKSARVVVLKRAPLDEAASGSVAESLRREIEVLREGRIDRVTALVDHGEVAGLPFVVLEHINGQPLDAILASGPLERGTTMLLARDLALALASLHAKGWVHGDVTPSNIVIDDAGEATLVDLGIARRTNELREMPAGKPGYASPEAALGKPARPSDDVYGWGVVVAECLLGGRLFRETDLAEAATRPERLPNAVMDVHMVASALSREPERRPAAQAIAAGIEPSHEGRRSLADAVNASQLRGAGPRSVPARGGVGVTKIDLGFAEPVAAKTVGSLVVAARNKGPGSHGPHPPSSRTSALAIVAIVLSVAMLFGAVGAFFLGRRTGANAAKRRETTTLTLPTIPPRAEVKLDGRTLLTPNATTNLDIEPGSHKLTVQIARREPREYEFVAEAGDHVVLVVVPVQRGGKDTDP